MGLGRTNKRKGSDAERYYAKVFRDLGFKFCKTARLASRMLDNCKIDLAFLPFNVQIKGGAHKGLNVFKVFKAMRELLNENYPSFEDVHKRPFVLIHRESIYSKKNDGDVTYMKADRYNRYRISNPNIPKAEVLSKEGYEDIVKIDFSVFKEFIVPMYL